MNDIFKPYLRRFTLVFFDDILVYNPSINSHEVHLRMVLHTMRVNKLYAKRIKCTFGVYQVEYIGHIISEKGVATGLAKVTAMQKWPSLRNLKQLRGFLGFTGYYRIIIRDYAAIG
ncbi:putative mitochondrial protein [Tanacetum coccineum]